MKLANRLALKQAEPQKPFIEFPISEQVAAQLETAEFDNWKFTEDQLPQLIEHMFSSLHIQQRFNIEQLE